MTDERRARILSAAREIFAEEGFRTAEVKTIAERAGVGKATIYKFFQSKEELLMVIVEEDLAQLRDQALRELVGSQPPLERLENACLAIARYISQNRPFARVLVQEAGDFAGEIQRRHLEMMEQNLPLADAFFNELRKDGYFLALDTRETVRMMMNLVMGSAYAWAITGEGSPEDLAVKYIRILIEGMRVDPGEPAR